MAPGSPNDLPPEFFAKMVESVGVGVAIYGRDGRYLYVNRAYADLFDVAPSDLTGTALWEVVPAIEADRFGSYWASFADEETRTAETVHRYNGREVPVATVTTRRSIDDTPYHFGTIKDITERKAHEREIERQNERLERFASVVSHDLRNPLSVARGYVDLLGEDIDRDELRLVDNALERMNTLVTELLELARSNEGARETEPVSLTDTAERAWRSVETPEAVLDVPGADRRVIADQSRLQQLFENLFRNAVEHAGPDVRVTVGTTPEGFYIEDDGPGIPPGERDCVFGAGYTTDENGTGFGLSIVQGIVAGHDWEIGIAESTTGGTRFEITGVEFVTQ